MSAAAEAGSLLLLGATLAVAVVRPRGLPEAAASVPAAAILIAAGAVSLGGARDELRQLGPTLGFLAAMLVVAEVCEREGLFAAAGGWMRTAARGSPVRLLGLVFAVASVVTAMLSLDATVVLLTPVVFATAVSAGMRAKPHVYACVHLANSASLLLPISNLSNLLALRASGVSFARFGALMALPWAVAIGVEWLVLRSFFAADLGGKGLPPREAAPRPQVSRHVPAILALALLAFVLSSTAGVEPAWIAAGAAVALGVPALVRRRASAGDVGAALGIPFLAFVAGLGVVVAAVRANGLQDAIGHAIPGGAGLGALLAIAAIGAVLANVVNNLPAILILLPVVAPGGAGAVLAALIGVNVGPNLTYVGSLATLLWRRSLSRHGADPQPAEFARLGIAVVPAALVVSTVALWLSLKAVGP